MRLKSSRLGISDPPKSTSLFHTLHVTNSRNRKLICVTSSNERVRHRCVDLSDHSRYLNQFWYKDICIKFYGIMRWTLAYTTACTAVQAVITACTVVQAVLTVRTVVSCSNKFSTKLGNLCWATGTPQKLCGPRIPYDVLPVAAP